MKFNFNQSKDLNFKNFLGEHAPRLPKQSQAHNKNSILVWKSQVILSILESWNPVKLHL